jgi:cysteine synthase B
MSSESSSTRTLAGPQRVVDLIGNTPLIDLSSLVENPEVKVYAKAEFANPAGSVKDRAGLAMVRVASEAGLLRKGRRILDATSGNTGIAYAMVGAAMGIPVTLCLASNASPERLKILKAYGAELVLTSPMDGTDGAIVEARRMVKEDPKTFTYLDQYSNEANWRAHFEGTGPEIWEQTSGLVTHFITGLGTSGTFMGVGRFLLSKNSRVRLITVEPDGPFHGLEGMKHMASAIVPPIYDPDMADEARSCSTEKAYAMVLRLARERGLLVGVSSGCNVASAVDLAAEIDSGVIVTILCDSADKYLTEKFWESE